MTREGSLELPALEEGGGEIAARSPLQLFWRRLRQDRVALAALVFIGILIVFALAAPLIVKLFGAPPPNQQSTKALDQYSEVLRSNPSDVESLKGMAYLKLQLNNFDDAREIYAKAIALAPSDPDLLYAAAVANCARAREAIVSDPRLGASQTGSRHSPTRFAGAARPKSR